MDHKSQDYRKRSQEIEYTLQYIDKLNNIIKYTTQDYNTNYKILNTYHKIFNIQKKIANIHHKILNKQHRILNVQPNILKKKNPFIYNILNVHYKVFELSNILHDIVH